MPDIYRPTTTFPDLTSTGGAVYGDKGKLAVTATGTSGQVLTSAGAGAAPSWETPASPGVGTVTSVGLSVPTGLTVAGSPVTSAGTLAVSLQSGYTIPGGGTSGYVLTSQGAATPIWAAPSSSSPGGSNTQVQFNDSGAFGADSTFTFTKASDELGVNNITSQSGVDLAIYGAVGGLSHGRHVSVTGGSTTVNGATAGTVTVAGGTPLSGTSTTAGGVTIKTGDVQNNSGAILITTGTYPSSYATPGTVITVKPTTPTTSTGVSAQSGAGILIEGGPGQAHNNLFGNDTGGTGGVTTVKSGSGGNALASGNTRTGGDGGTLTLSAGDGGSATGSSGTRNGGNGGPVIVATGTAGTGATANGTDGDFTLKTGGTTRLLIAGATGVWTVNGDVGTTGQVLTANTGAPPSWETPTSVTPAALTKTDDTNVTLTLGGTPATALLQATSLTLGWTGQLSVARGGTGLGSYTTGDLVYASGATTLAGLADVATGQVLVSGGAGVAPAYSATPTVTTATASRTALGTTSTDGLIALNATAATSGTTVQISPRQRLSGAGWDTDDATSRTVSFFTEVLPTSGTTVAGSWKLGYIDPVTSAISYPLTVNGNGSVATISNVTTPNDYTMSSAGGRIIWSNSGTRLLTGSSAGQMSLTNASNAGVGLDATTAGTLKVRTTAYTGDGSITLLNSGYTGYSQMTEMTAPAAGAANTVRIYAEDNGAGKTRLMALFNTGAAQQIAIEP